MRALTIGTAPSDSVLVFDTASSAQTQAVAFGIELKDVIRVIEIEGQVVAVPLAPELCRGIVNHSGRIVTVVDPAPLLGLPAQSAEPSLAVIVGQRSTSKGHLGLQVLRIREIVRRERIVRADVQVQRCISWVGRLDSRLVHVIEVRHLLQELGQRFGTAPGVDR